MLVPRGRPYYGPAVGEVGDVSGGASVWAGGELSHCCASEGLAISCDGVVDFGCGISIWLFLRMCMLEKTGVGRGESKILDTNGTS